MPFGSVFGTSSRLPAPPLPPFHRPTTHPPLAPPPAFLPAVGGALVAPRPPPRPRTATRQRRNPEPPPRPSRDGLVPVAAGDERRVRAAEANEDGSYAFDLERAFEREPGHELLTALVTTPLVVTVTLGETTLATRTVDLTPFARGELEIGSDAEPLAPVPFPVADDQEADNPDAANPLPANPLLATATVDVRIVASEPFVSAEDASRGRVATFAPLAIASLPARLLETNDANLVGDRSPFEFTVAVPLAGVPHAVIPGGVIVEVPAEEAEDDGGEPEPEPNPPTREIRWAPDAAVTRWLPAATVADLTRRIKGRGTLYPLEIARYCAADSGASDPAYANYAALAPASLDAWLGPRDERARAPRGSSRPSSGTSPRFRRPTSPARRRSRRSSCPRARSRGRRRRRRRRWRLRWSSTDRSWRPGSRPRPRRCASRTCSRGGNPWARSRRPRTPRGRSGRRF